MGIKAVDGFDTYLNPRADMLARGGGEFLQWQIYGANNTPTLTFVPGLVEGDGNALKIVGVGGFHGSNDGLPTQWLVAVWGKNPRPASGSTVGVRVSCGAAASSVGSGIAFFFYDTTTGGASAVCQMTVFLNPDNYAIEIWRGAFSSLIAISANNLWQGDSPMYVEIQPTINATVGAVTVRIDYDSVSGAGTSYTASGLNNQVSANAWWDATGFTPILMSGVSGNTAAIILDDIYYTDNSTDPGLYPNNTFIGDIHAYTRFPVGNNAVQWTPLALSNWQQVNESAMDSDTTYNSTQTAGNQDTFNLAALPGVVNNILAIILQVAARKDDAGAHSIKQALISGGTTYYGTNKSLPNTTYADFTDVFVNDPNTSANWTIIHANGMSIGYNLVS